MKKNVLFLVVMACITLAGCADGELAQKANGTWATTLEGHDYEGNVITSKVVYSFKYVPDGETNGGTFVEQVTMPYSESYADMDVSCTVRTTVRGDWEVILGDLFITYRLSTLHVDVINVDYEITDEEAWLEAAATEIFAAMLGSDAGGIDEGTLADEIRKDIYPGIRETYEEENNGGEGDFYEDLKIENGVMTFLTGDAGKVSLKKVDDKTY